MYMFVAFSVLRTGDGWKKRLSIHDTFALTGATEGEFNERLTQLFNLPYVRLFNELPSKKGGNLARNARWGLMMKLKDDLPWLSENDFGSNALRRWF